MNDPRKVVIVLSGALYALLLLLAAHAMRPYSVRHVHCAPAQTHLNLVYWVPATVAIAHP
jgi:hypothetical protein